MTSSPYLVPLTSLTPASRSSGAVWHLVLTSIQVWAPDIDHAGTSLTSFTPLLVCRNLRTNVQLRDKKKKKNGGLLTGRPASISFLNCMNTPCLRTNPSRWIKGDSVARRQNIYRELLDWFLPIAGFRRISPFEPLKNTKERRCSFSWSTGGSATKRGSQFKWQLPQMVKVSPLWSVALKCPPEITASACQLEE